MANWTNLLTDRQLAISISAADIEHRFSVLG
jgi:hypothetical protein